MGSNEANASKKSRKGTFMTQIVKTKAFKFKDRHALLNTLADQAWVDLFPVSEDKGFFFIERKYILNGSKKRLVAFWEMVMSHKINMELVSEQVKTMTHLR